MPHLLEIGTTLVPDGLIERTHTFTPVLGVIAFVGFVLLAFARLSRQNLYRSLFVAWTKTNGLRSYLKEALPLEKRGSVLLLVNYVISGSLMLYLRLSQEEMDETSRIVFSCAIPLVLLLLTPIGLLFTGFISGEYSKLRSLFSMKLIGAEILGLVCFVASLIWMLNLDFVPYIWMVVVAMVVIEFISRLVKGVQFVSSEGVSWYYIILYLCTLEILPLFVAYLLVMKNFT
jgi:hypothetical protein